MTTNLDPKTEAQELLRKSNTYSLPVDLDSVAKFLKIRVLYEEFEDNISGLLVVKNGKHAIGVNKNHHPNRQRFTIAHEIGHFVLHHKFSDDPKNDLHIDKKWAYFRAAEPGQKVDDKERQANQFAAELLMPEALLKQSIKKLAVNLSDDTDIFRLASSLQVSEQALAIRLVNLKIIKHY
jgi:Zn-dependent peptidase ImmA (M78 family)